MTLDSLVIHITVQSFLNSVILGQCVPQLIVHCVKNNVYCIFNFLFNCH